MNLIKTKSFQLATYSKGDKNSKGMDSPLKKFKTYLKTEESLSIK